MRGNYRYNSAILRESSSDEDDGYNADVDGEQSKLDNTEIAGAQEKSGEIEDEERSKNGEEVENGDCGEMQEERSQDGEEIENGDFGEMQEEQSQDSEEIENHDSDGQDGEELSYTTSHSIELTSEDSEFESSSKSGSDSDNSSNTSRVEEDIFQEQLYEGCNLSFGASYLLIIQFTRKYKLARKALKSLLKLIRLHCPRNVEINLPKTPRDLIKSTITID